MLAGVALPPLQHVEVDVRDRERVSQTPLAPAELPLQVGPVAFELLDSLAAYGLMAVRVIREVLRDVDRLPGTVQRVRQPHQPAQQGAATGLARQRAETAAGKPLHEIQQDRSRLVDLGIPVAQRRHPLQRVHIRKARRLVATARVNVDGLVVGLGLFERGPDGEARRPGDLEQLHLLRLDERVPHPQREAAIGRASPP